MELFNFPKGKHDYFTRHCDDPSIPKYKLKVIKGSFLYQGPDMWIKLEDSLKWNSNSLCSFKSELRKLLLSKY